MTSIVNSFRSGPQLEVDMEGLTSASRVLTDAAGRAEDMRIPLERVKVLLIEGHKRQFESHGSFLGDPWPANSPETTARKAREGVGSLIDLMIGSGDLHEALSGGTGSRTRVSKGSVSVGVGGSLIQALFAQGGAAGGRRGVEPARPVLGINEAERAESVSILTDFLLGRP